MRFVEQVGVDVLKQVIELQHGGTGSFLRSVRVHNSARSEEHTSELQSQFRISYAVFCLK